MTQIAGPVAILTLPARRRGLGPVRLSLILGLTAMLLIVAQPRRDMAGACRQTAAQALAPVPAPVPGAATATLPAGCPRAEAGAVAAPRRDGSARAPDLPPPRSAARQPAAGGSIRPSGRPARMCRW